MLLCSNSLIYNRRNLFNMIDQEKIKFATKLLLEALGEDPSREGLQETPTRVSNMYNEIFSGLYEDPKKHLKIFIEESANNQPISVRDIPLRSVCEHHLLPFIGVAHITYIPKNGKIIGLSKFARIVECFAKRPQVQERLTNQIAEFLYDNLDPVGVEVIVEAEHLCMTMRGIKAAGSKTITRAVRGNVNNAINRSYLGD